MSYRIEKLSQENISDLVEIYRDAFGKDVDPAYLTKKQDTSFAGCSYVGFIAYSDSNEPVAFYGVFPCLTIYKGTTYVIAQSGDTMTHSNHRGKGLFTLLAKRTYEYCREIGIQLVFGFPNQNSYPGFVRKLDWIHFDDLQAYHIQVSKIPIIGLKKRLGIQPDTQKRNKILDKYEQGMAFPSSCREQDVPVVLHSEAFYAYKQGYETSRVLKIAHKNVWIKVQDEMFLLVGDVEKCSEKEFESVLIGLKQLALKLGLPHLRFHCSTDTWLDKLMHQYGTKMESTYAIGGINFSDTFPMEKMKFTMVDNDTF